MRHRLPVALAALVAFLTAACAGTPAAPAPAPVPARAETAAPVAIAAPRAPSPALPAYPKVTGALVPDLVYPPDGYLLSVRDSTFVFGNDGNDRAYVSSLANETLASATTTDLLRGNLDAILGTLNLDLGTGRHLLMISDESATDFPQIS